MDDCLTKLKVLADATRLSVIRILMTGPRRVGELNEDIGCDQSLLSHHLRTLRDAGLVVAERDGKGVRYHLAPAVEVPNRAWEINLGCCRMSFEE